jgi:hypothetical protein
MIIMIARSDYPGRWPQLMPFLADALSSATPAAMSAIFSTLSAIFQRYKRDWNAAILPEIWMSRAAWKEIVVALCLETLPGMQDMTALGPIWEATLRVVKSLSIQYITDTFLEHLPELFELLNSFMRTQGVNELKVQVYQIVHQYILYHLPNIANWGTTESNLKDQPTIDQLQAIWDQLLTAIFDAVADPEGLIALVTTTFDALGELAESKQQDFFLRNDNLLKLCFEVLIPCISLRDQYLEDFEVDPLGYFERNVLDCPKQDQSRRSVTYTFLRVLSRFFQAELHGVFEQYSQELIGQYSPNPAKTWRAMDTAIFLMGAIAAQSMYPYVGVFRVAKGFDLDRFVGTFIQPHLDPATDLFLLQADALKFIADFRRFITPVVLYPVLELAVALMNSPSVAVILYATYCFEKNVQMTIDNNLATALSGVDVAEVVKKLFDMFTIDRSYNVIAVQCLLELVAKGDAAVHPLISGIVGTVMTFLSNKGVTQLLRPRRTQCSVRSRRGQTGSCTSAETWRHSERPSPGCCTHSARGI